MDIHEARITHLRERPPVWPQRGSDGDNQPRRWSRDREPFEDGALPELYPGALVMEDLTAVGDDAATMRVLARYTVARLFMLTASAELAEPDLRTERRIALEHLGLLADYDWERRALVRLAMHCREEPGTELIEAAITAAEAAAKRSHTLGAFTLYRAAYELAIAKQWWAAAAQVAGGIAQLARLEEAHRSIRLWRRRAAVLEARARAAETAARAETSPSDCSGSTGSSGAEGSTVTARPGSDWPAHPGSPRDAARGARDDV